jgi:MoaA/NifB/PqqE/SkfB family radical SAM enzyme
VVVSTNGTLITADWAQQIVLEKLFDTMHFSIHGGKEVHDKVTGRSGAFQLVCNAIKAIQKYKEIYGGEYPRIGIDCVVTRENVGEFEKLASVAAKWNVHSLTVGNVVFTRPEILEKHKAVSKIENLREDFALSRLVLGPPGHEFSDEDVRIYLDNLKSIEDLWGQKYSILRWPPYKDDDIYRHYFDHGWVFRERCDYPWYSMRIHPTGKVIPCLGVVVGDIKEEGADRIWNNVHYRRFRKALFRNKLFPGCFRCCKLQ